MIGKRCFIDNVVPSMMPLILLVRVNAVQPAEPLQESIDRSRKASEAGDGNARRIYPAPSGRSLEGAANHR